MANRSRFDDLHDAYDPFRPGKAGTRYERLAAIVLKALRENATVVHDLRLVGTSEVKHQIDVTIESQGKRKRVLIECKDFDVSGDLVGLGIIRDFFGVVEDVKPDAAIVMTCNGFTEEARTYAKAKKIKLAVLRTPHDDDWRRRPRSIVATVSLGIVELAAFHLNLAADSTARLAAERAAAGLHPAMTEQHDPVFFNGTEDGRVQFNDYVSKHMNAHVPPLGQEQDVTISLRGMTLEIGAHDGHPLDFMRLSIRHRGSSESTTIQVCADTIATLIFETDGESESVVWEHDLRRFKIGDDGIVRELDLDEPMQS
jgi:hypothetical protein